MGWSERSKAGDLLSLFSFLYFLTYSTALYHLFKYCLFFKFFLVEHNCFTTLHSFLLYSK